MPRRELIMTVMVELREYRVFLTLVSVDLVIFSNRSSVLVEAHLELPLPSVLHRKEAS